MTITEIKYGHEIGKVNDYHRYIQQPCKICGKLRWAILDIQGNPEHDKCHTCSINMKGNKALHWKGGKSVSKKYIILYVVPTDPFYSMAHPLPNKEHRYILEHRLIMAHYLGRCLSPDEVVHHINGDTKDNRISNLELTNRVLHHKVHHQLKHKPNGQFAKSTMEHIQE